MNTESKIIHSKADIDNCILFIITYRALEKLKLKDGVSYISDVYKNETKWKLEHVVDMWKEKKGNFGTFYLNLDSELKIRLYGYFGVSDETDRKYLNRIGENPGAALFLNTSHTYTRLRNLMVFFLNHSIGESPAPWLSLPLKGLPATESSYGNSANWGKYILSLPSIQQEKIIRTILDNYQVENY